SRGSGGKKTSGSGGSRSSLILNLALDIAELQDGERDNDDHQHHRLRVGSTEVESLEAVGIDLVDEDLRSLPRTAAGRGVDDAERVEEREDDVDDQEKERRRRKQREYDRHEAPDRTRAVDRRSLDQRLRNRLETGEEE